MNKKLAAVVFMAAALAGCSASSSEETVTSDTAATEQSKADTSSDDTTQTSVSTETSEETSQSETSMPKTIRVGSLKGPTSMGIANMEYEDYMGEYTELMDYYMAAQADEIVTMLVKNELDIALVPANVASVLYNKTEGGVSVVDINTLGVLYIVECGDSITQISDLAGKTLYMTGKGTTPDYALQYLLAQNGLSTDDLTIEYKAEATEVASILEQDDTAIGLLPQPFVTTAMTSNENLHIALDLTKEWDEVSDSSLVTGVTIVRNEFMEEYPDAVSAFVSAHAQSVAAGEKDLDLTCERIEEIGIIKAAVAKKAYEYCNIVCITGDEMKTALSGYLEVLYDLSSESVGGALPSDDFYASY